MHKVEPFFRIWARLNGPIFYLQSPHLTQSAEPAAPEDAHVTIPPLFSYSISNRGAVYNLGNFNSEEGGRAYFRIVRNISHNYMIQQPKNIINIDN
jgi:hypothetical protein